MKTIQSQLVVLLAALAATPTWAIEYKCAPINGEIAFTATGSTVDTNNVLTAGLIPANNLLRRPERSVGGVKVGPITEEQEPKDLVFHENADNDTETSLKFSVRKGDGSFSGVVKLSQDVQDAIQEAVEANPRLFAANAPTQSVQTAFGTPVTVSRSSNKVPCISSVAISVQAIKDADGNFTDGFSGAMLLYVNGSKHGRIINFTGSAE